MGLVVDALDAHHQRAIDLGDRGKSGATEAEPEVAAKDFDESLADRLILRLSDTSRNDSRGEVRGQVRVVFVQIGIVQMAFDDASLQAIGNSHVRHAAVLLIHPPVTAEPVAAFHVLRRPGEEQLAKAKPRDEHVGFVDLAGLDLVPLDRIAGVIDFHPFRRARTRGP